MFLPLAYCIAKCHWAFPTHQIIAQIFLVVEWYNIIDKAEICVTKLNKGSMQVRYEILLE